MLGGVVVDAPGGVVDADLVGADNDLDRVVEGLGGVGGTVAEALAVMAEGQESESLHGRLNHLKSRNMTSPSAQWG